MVVSTSVTILLLLQRVPLTVSESDTFEITDEQEYDYGSDEIQPIIANDGEWFELPRRVPPSPPPPPPPPPPKIQYLLVNVPEEDHVMDGKMKIASLLIS